MVVIIAVAVIVLLLLLWAVMTSNSLIARRNRVHQCRSGICVALKQRNDLIPNLVATVKTYMVHERGVLEKISELRSKALSASERGQIEDGNEISSLLTRLNIAVENYPELKADSQFLNLQARIAGMEDELQAIRRTYNAAVTDYNNAIEMFPSSIIAGWKGHTPEALVEIPQSEMRNVNVSELLK